jgi:hypothetical protein
MGDVDQTGPWLLALGAVTIGVGAAARLLGRRRADDER